MEENRGEFFVRSVIVARQGIRHNVLFAREPLTVALDSFFGEV